MTIKHITPNDAFALIGKGALLIDIREKDEYLRENIPGAQLHALSVIESRPPKPAPSIIFHCRSGNRTAVNATRLAATVPGSKVYVLEGGIEAWRDAGLPTRKDNRQPLELMRQVQIGAGSLVVLGVALGFLVHPGFHALAGLVGGGLLMAGATGFCGMARLLKRAPWNRAALSTAQ